MRPSSQCEAPLFSKTDESRKTLNQIVKKVVTTTILIIY